MRWPILCIFCLCLSPLTGLTQTPTPPSEQNDPLPELMAQLYDKDPDLRTRAATRLKAMGPRAASAYTHLRLAFKREKNPDIKSLLAQAILAVQPKDPDKLTDSQRAEQVKRWARLAVKGDPVRQRMAITKLASFKHHAAPTLSLLDELARLSPDPFTRRDAGRAAERIRKAVIVAQRQTESTTTQPTTQPTYTISAKRSASILKVMADLDDYHKPYRLKAIDRLTGFGYDARLALNKLSSMAAADPDPDIRAAAARAIGQIIRIQAPPQRQANPSLSPRRHNR